MIPRLSCAQRFDLQRPAPLRGSDDARRDVDERLVTDRHAGPALALVGERELLHDDGTEEAALAVADPDQIHLFAADARLQDHRPAPGRERAVVGGDRFVA